MDWRNSLRSPVEYQELNASNMAATRIMKGLGLTFKDIGKTCKQLNIPYNEEDSPFDRAVNILREVYHNTSLINFIDAKVTKNINLILDDLLDAEGTGLVFVRVGDSTHMTALVRGVGLKSSALGAIIIKPGAKFLKEESGVEIWEQDPITLINSFKGG